MIKILFLGALDEGVSDEGHAWLTRVLPCRQIAAKHEELLLDFTSGLWTKIVVMHRNKHTLTLFTVNLERSGSHTQLQILF